MSITHHYTPLPSYFSYHTTRVVSLQSKTVPMMKFAKTHYSQKQGLYTLPLYTEKYEHHSADGGLPYFLDLGLQPPVSASAADVSPTRTKYSPEVVSVVNPAFLDGTIQPSSITDLDQPLHLYAPPTPAPALSLAKLPTLGTPSFRLTKNVSSTLSKVSSPVDYCTLPRSPLPPPSSGLPSQTLPELQSAPLTLMSNSPSLSARSSPPSNSSHSTSDMPSTSTSSSLYYVDCSMLGQRANDGGHSNRTSSISSDSTLTGSSASGGDHPTVTGPGDPTFPPPPPQSETMAEQRAPPKPSRLPPPPPPPRHHLVSGMSPVGEAYSYQITTLPRRKPHLDEPGGGGGHYQATTLRSFQTRLPPAAVTAFTTNSVTAPPSGAVESFSCSSSTSSYAEPSISSVSSTTLQPTPPPPPLEVYPMAQLNTVVTPLFARNSSPTYGWVYQEGHGQSDVVSLAESGLSSVPSSHGTSESQKRLSHAFDPNNNSSHPKPPTFLYQNKAFIGDVHFPPPPPSEKDDDDDGQIKARLNSDQAYTMFFDAEDDNKSRGTRNNSSPISNEAAVKKPENCCICLGRNVIVTIVILLLFILLLLFGITVYRQFVLHKEESPFAVVDGIVNFLKEHFDKTAKNETLVTTITPILAASSSTLVTSVPPITTSTLLTTTIMTSTMMGTTSTTTTPPLAATIVNATQSVATKPTESTTVPFRSSITTTKSPIATSTTLKTVTRKTSSSKALDMPGTTPLPLNPIATIETLSSTVAAVLPSNNTKELEMASSDAVEMRVRPHPANQTTTPTIVSSTTTTSEVVTLPEMVAVDVTPVSNQTELMGRATDYKEVEESGSITISTTIDPVVEFTTLELDKQSSDPEDMESTTRRTTTSPTISRSTLLTSTARHPTSTMVDNFVVHGTSAPIVPELPITTRATIEEEKVKTTTVVTSSANVTQVGLS